MQIVVEVGDWEHECCGPAYERDAVVELTCLEVSGPVEPTRYVECRHDINTEPETVEVRGRVADLSIEHLDGSLEPIERLPSGRALRGFDEGDDGHLARPWTGKPVTNDSNRFLLTIAT